MKCHQKLRHVRRSESVRRAHQCGISLETLFETGPYTDWNLDALFQFLVPGSCQKFCCPPPESWVLSHKKTPFTAHVRAWGLLWEEVSMKQYLGPVYRRPDNHRHSLYKLVWRKTTYGYRVPDRFFEVKGSETYMPAGSLWRAQVK